MKPRFAINFRAEELQMTNLSFNRFCKFRWETVRRRILEGSVQYRTHACSIDYYSEILQVRAIATARGSDLNVAIDNSVVKERAYLR